MNYDGLKVLLFEGYARQILPYLKALKKLGCETYVICNSKFDVGYVSKYTDHKILGICDTEKYAESERFLVDTIKKGHFDIVVPMGDFSASILAANKKLLLDYCKVAVVDRETFFPALDKLNVMRVCMENKIPCPTTLLDVCDYEKLRSKDFSYPIVIKPRSDCGARGFHYIGTEEELKKIAVSLDLSSQVIQEYIPQSDMNMSCGLFIDREGGLKSAYTYASRRWYPLKGGTGTFNQLIDRPDIVEMCYKLAKKMRIFGTVGFDLIQDYRDGIPKIIEINPRVLACAKICFEAGINQAQQTLELAFGEPVTKFDIIRPLINVRMSQIDILWFLKSPNRFKCSPSWFSRKNTMDQTFSWDDPLPWFVFLLRGLGRLKKENKARE